MLVESVLPIKAGTRVRIRTTEIPFLGIGASIRRCARQWLVYRTSLELDSATQQAGSEAFRGKPVVKL